MPFNILEVIIWVLQSLLTYLEAKIPTDTKSEVKAVPQERPTPSASSRPIPKPTPQAQIRPETWTCAACTLINPIEATLCDACEGPQRAMDSSSVVVYGSNTSESSLALNSESRERIQDKRWLMTAKDAAFPPNHEAWLKAYERSPDTPLRQTYVRGIVQPDIDPGAPVIKIGLIFLEGADKPSVTHAEMKGETKDAPNQKTPEWRVATAATLLKKFVIRDDLSIIRPDDSLRILEANKTMEPQRKRLPPPPQSDQAPQRSSTKRQSTGEFPNLTLVRRNIQDHALTIDSDCIDIINKERKITCEYDITSTLIEIDMQSISNLLANFREIISSGGRNVSPKDITVILDTMINDVRRLCSRSPTLFRMATRSTIAKSKDTRYGVNYDNVFATMTTSEGIRIFIERSITYYLSLDENSTDQETVRPKFLQMLVMLLALLNNDDLKKISELLEDTFKIPGNREGLELLILKVLPLQSINSKVFMEDLLVARNQSVEKSVLRDPKHQLQHWQKLQQDLAEEGYILPVPIKTNASDEVFDDDLEALANALELEDQDSVMSSRQSTHTAMDVPNGGLITQYPKSWLAQWPEESGVRESTIFKHIQHCGKLKQEGNHQKATVKAVNYIPHLDITSEDKENEYVAVFTNGARFRVHSQDPDDISTMKKGKYTLKELEGTLIVDLDIDEEVLNQSAIEATTQHNDLVDSINDFLGGRKEKKTFRSSKSSPIIFTRLEVPIEATRVWAELLPQSGQRQLCAEAFKLGDRIVIREDILRGMNDILARLKANISRIEKAIPAYRKNSNDEISKMNDLAVSNLTERLGYIKKLESDAIDARKELAGRNSAVLPTDPITTVIYTSFIQTSGEKPEWQPYVSQLHSDRERLIIQSKKLRVEKVHASDVLKLEFLGSNLTLDVQPLKFPYAATNNEAPCPLKRDDEVLWLGHYIVHVQPAAGMKKNSYIVQAYFRVLSQKRTNVSKGNQQEKLHVVFLN